MGLGGFMTLMLILIGAIGKLWEKFVSPPAPWTQDPRQVKKVKKRKAYADKRKKVSQRMTEEKK